MSYLQRIHQELEALPIIEGRVGGKTPLYCERYLLSGIDRAITPLPVIAMLVQLGGSRVLEGQAGQWRNKSLPSSILLIPPACATNWRYSGTADVGNLYFVGPHEGLHARFLTLLGEAKGPLLFSDALVGSAVQQIFAELQKGVAADDEYIEKLADVLLEQSFRVLTTPGMTGLAPSHVHYPRLQKVLQYIRANLPGDLSVANLAGLTGVSQTHFRRLFQEALGASVRQYVQAARMDQARKLLSTSSMPISKIAEECGFSSQSHLTTSFRKAFAATPAEYRNQLQRARGGHAS
jgi:AraC family transcriptional regulator